MVRVNQPGRHVDETFLADLRDRLKGLQSDIYPLVMEALLGQPAAELPRGCDCGSEDEASSDNDDSYCPHTMDVRTTDTLGFVISHLEEIAKQVLALTDHVNQRADSLRVAREKKLQRRAKYVQEWSRSTWDSDPSCQTYPPAHFSRCFLQELPVEILDEILQRVARMDRNIPLMFCGISSRLRNVTLGIPALWSIIDIMHPPNRITLNLERSIGTPLDVRMRLNKYLDDVDRGTTVLQAFINRLSPHYHRIRKLDAVLYHETWSQLAMDFISGNNLRDLQELYIGTGHLLEPSNFIPCTAPIWRMEQLSLHKVEITATDTLPQFPTRNLRLFETHTMLLLELENLLTKMPSLESLEFHEGESRALMSSEADAQYLVQLQRLRYVEFEGMSYLSARAILDLIDAPNLQSLVVKFGTEPSIWGDVDTGTRVVEEWWPQAFVFFPALTTLHMTGCWMSDEHWTTMFRVLPELDSLTLGSCGLKGPELDALGRVMQTASDVACPKLRELTLNNETFLTSADVKRVIFNRLGLPGPTASKIRTLAMRGWDELNIDVGDIRDIRGVVDEFTLGVFGVEEVLRDQGISRTPNEMLNRRLDGDGDEDWESDDHDHASSDSGSEGSWLSGDEAVLV